MASLVVRNLDQNIVDALKKKSVEDGISAEAEHRKILKQYLFPTQRKSFAQALADMPNIGIDKDFQRIDDNNINNHVFT